MKRIKKAILFIFFLVGLNQAAYSSHLVGGEFKVNWVSGNTFHVTLRMFRDCSPASSGFPTSFTIGVYDNITNSLLQTFVLPLGPVTNISLGNGCYTPSGICIQEGIYENNIVLATNPNGYYLTTQICCRTSAVDNIQIPGSTGFLFYAQIPDAAYQNSTPDFGSYLNDGYLCLEQENNLSFPVTEPDGDSLVYSLVTPFQGTTAGGSSTGSWPKPFTNIAWQTPYNLTNIVGGTPPMSINPVTGVITCYPTTSGVFVFAVKVEEYRMGIKLGEVIRDIQYYALPCMIDDLPEILLPDTIDISSEATACFDIVTLDADTTDTISMIVSSPLTFANGATLSLPAPYSIVGTDTLYQFYYTNEDTGLPDSVLLHAPVDSAGTFYGVGGIGMRYCWATTCDDMGAYEVSVSASSLGCSGDTGSAAQLVTLNVTIDTDVTLMGNVLSANGGVAWQWVDCNNGYSPLAGATGQTYTATSAGSYAVVVSNGTCTDTSACYALSTGINQLEQNAGITIYPSPTSGQFFVESTTAPITNITITDLSGRRVYQQPVNDLKKIALNPNLPAGVYLVYVQLYGRQTVQRIVKQ